MRPSASRRSLSWWAGLVLVPLLLAGCGTPVAPGTTGDGDPADVARDLAGSSDDVRDEAARDSLTWTRCAADAALARAEALVGEPELTHAPLDDVIADCGVTVAAENLSRAPAGTPAEEVVAAWMDSPGHRSNLLDPELTQVGVGCVEDGDALLCSQVFLGPPTDG